MHVASAYKAYFWGSENVELCEKLKATVTTSNGKLFMLGYKFPQRMRKGLFWAKLIQDLPSEVPNSLFNTWWRSRRSQGFSHPETMIVMMRAMQRQYWMHKVTWRFLFMVVLECIKSPPWCHWCHCCPKKWDEPQMTVSLGTESDCQSFANIYQCNYPQNARHLMVKLRIRAALLSMYFGTSDLNIFTSFWIWQHPIERSDMWNDIGWEGEGPPLYSTFGGTAAWRIPIKSEFPPTVVTSKKCQFTGRGHPASAAAGPCDGI